MTTGKLHIPHGLEYLFEEPRPELEVDIPISLIGKEISEVKSPYLIKGQVSDTCPFYNSLKKSKGEVKS